MAVRVSPKWKAAVCPDFDTRPGTTNWRMGGSCLTLYNGSKGCTTPRGQLRVLRRCAMTLPAVHNPPASSRALMYPAEWEISMGFRTRSSGGGCRCLSSSCRNTRCTALPKRGMLLTPHHLNSLPDAPRSAHAPPPPPPPPTTLATCCGSVSWLSHGFKPVAQSECRR